MRSQIKLAIAKSNNAMTKYISQLIVGYSDQKKFLLYWEKLR